MLFFLFFQRRVRGFPSTLFPSFVLLYFRYPKTNRNQSNPNLPKRKKDKLLRPLLPWPRAFFLQHPPFILNCARLLSPPSPRQISEILSCFHLISFGPHLLKDLKLSFKSFLYRPSFKNSQLLGLGFIFPRQKVFVPFCCFPFTHVLFSKEFPIQL